MNEKDKEFNKQTNTSEFVNKIHSNDGQTQKEVQHDDANLTKEEFKEIDKELTREIKLIKKSSFAKKTLINIKEKRRVRLERKRELVENTRAKYNILNGEFEKVTKEQSLKAWFISNIVQKGTYAKRKSDDDLKRISDEEVGFDTLQSIKDRKHLKPLERMWITTSMRNAIKNIFIISLSTIITIVVNTLLVGENVVDWRHWTILFGVLFLLSLIPVFAIRFILDLKGGKDNNLRSLKVFRITNWIMIGINLTITLVLLISPLFIEYVINKTPGNLARANILANPTLENIDRYKTISEHTGQIVWITSLVSIISTLISVLWKRLAFKSEYKIDKLILRHRYNTFWTQNTEGKIRLLEDKLENVEDLSNTDTVEIKRQIDHLVSINKTKHNQLNEIANEINIEISKLYNKKYKTK